VLIAAFALRTLSALVAISIAKVFGHNRRQL